MKSSIGTALMLVPLNGGRYRKGAATVSSTGEDYPERINGLSGKQRDAVFFGVIDDAGFDCQHMTIAETRAPVQRYPARPTHCSDGRNWIAAPKPPAPVPAAGSETAP
jgi:hypothetical protein